MATDAEALRRRLGEKIPTPGGTEADTNFTDAEIDDLLDQAGGDLDKATEAGWLEKAAMFAALVDTAEGTSKRSFSQMRDAALDMAKRYGPGDEGGNAGTTIHQIVRR